MMPTVTTSTLPLWNVVSVHSTVAVTVYQSIKEILMRIYALRYRVNWQIYTSYTVAAEHQLKYCSISPQCQYLDVHNVCMPREYLSVCVIFLISCLVEWIFFFFKARLNRNICPVELEHHRPCYVLFMFHEKPMNAYFIYS